MRIFTIGALICLLVMSTFQFAMAGWTGATADQFISATSSQSAVYCPALAVGPDPGGELYAVWAQRESGLPYRYEVYFSKSTDGGVNWTGTTADQRISANDMDGVYNGGIYGARRIDIAVNSVGYIYVVWPEDYVQADWDTTQEVILVMSTDGGSSWHQPGNTILWDFPVSDTNTTAPVNSPNIAIDNNDNIHVIWNQNESVSGTAEIHYSYSDDDGETWTGRSADRAISYVNYHPSYSPDIDVDVNNNIYIVWQESYGTYDQRIEYGKSTDGGITWSCETQDNELDTANYVIVFPRIKAKPGPDSVAIIYACDDTAYFVGTTDGGTNWYQSMIWPGLHDLDGYYSMYGPDLAVTTTGTMVAIIDDEDPRSLSLDSPNRQIFATYSFDYGHSWSPALQSVSNYDTTARFDRTYIPSVLITNTDILHCLYSTNSDPESNSNQEMAYSRNDDLGVLPGSIEGTVTELDETTPIVDVEVTVKDSDEEIVGTINTLPDGSYRFAFGFEPGTYSVEFRKFSHHDTSETDVEVIANIPTIVDISMRPYAQGIVSGVIYEETGTNPLPSVIIEAVDQSAVLWDTDTTDANGQYELSLWPDTYDISFSDTNEQFHDTTIADVVVTEDGTVNLDVDMEWAIPADDIGPITINEPAGYMMTGQSYTPTVTVENFGYQEQTFDLNFIIQDPSFTEVYNETYTGASVDSLGTVQIEFSSDYTPLSAGNYQLAATVINTGDENTGNDIKVNAITAYAHQSTGGPDDYGYSFRDNLAPCGPEFNWIDISVSGTQLNPTSHYFMSAELPIGFSFEFYGETYTTMYVNSHGSLHLGSYGTWLSTNDCPIPSPTTPISPMLLPWWDYKNVRFEIGQGVYYQYFDDPTNDYTVVQWNTSTGGSNYDTTECEVIIYQDGRILFQYNKVSNVNGGMGQLATIGMEYDVPPLLYGISYLCDDDNPANRLFDGLAIEWITDIGEPGSVSGVVTDADTDLPIEGVYVEADVPGVYDFTNGLGEYSLPGLYACDYSISFSHVDYTDTTVTGVTVTANTNTTLDVEMQPPLLGYPYLPGDVNMFGGNWPPAATGPDVTYLVNFFRGLPSTPCKFDGFWCSADANGDCNIIGSDVTKLVNVFRGIGSVTFCSTYEPLWHTPAELPAEEPGGWPGCEPMVTGARVIPGEGVAK